MKNFFLVVLGALLLAVSSYGGYRYGFRAGYVAGAASEMSQRFFDIGFTDGRQAART